MNLPPPEGLQTAGIAFWNKVLSSYDLTEGHDQTRLFLACRCLDEIRECEQLVTVEGRFISDRFGQSRENPASKAIRENKILFCRIIRELGLDLTIPEDPRPRRQY